MPGTPETVIAFDFGLRRIGVAVGQQVTSSASPLAVVGNGEERPGLATDRICGEGVAATTIDCWHAQLMPMAHPRH